MVEEKLSGTVDSISHMNQENGFTVLDLETSDGEVFTVVGKLSNVIPGEKVTFTGSWSVHPSYGKQFRAESCEHEQIKTAADQFTYLASGAVKGIREGIARRIIEAFGEASFDVIEKDPVRLATIKGISRERAKEISEEFSKTFAVRETLIALEKYGINSGECLKIYELYGAKAASVIEHNPYVLCSENIGISFERADAIASGLSEKPDDYFRVSAGIKYVLVKNLGNGHTYIPREKLIEPCSDFLEISPEEVNDSITALAEDRQVVVADIAGREGVFLPELYKAERDAAQQLLFMKNFPPSGSKATDKRIQKAEIIGGIVYNEQQKKAIKTAVERGLLILTGGPGTGKTTTLKGILRLFEEDGLDVVLTAPTGRAAKRMSELTGREAKTIHRLLEVEWDRHDRAVFQRNRRNPISADAVIVDELSMVDVRVFDSLIEALPIGCRLVLVGDSDQLPPVGAGNVLHDIIGSGLLPVVQLTDVFRQAMESLIVANAHKIVKGEMPELTARDGDFFFMERVMPVEAAATIGELCFKRLPKAYGYIPVRDIQVICPSRIGETGTVSLNNNLQSLLNPASPDKKEHSFGNRVFREGDKVMQIKNNYDIEWKNTADNTTGMGVFNGDIGILEKLDPAKNTMLIRFDERECEYSFEFASQLEHAYAITVHKSQGSEFKAVIMPMTGIIDRLAYRNLLYTAVTRARELIIIVGSVNQLSRMVENNVKAKRYSALKSLLLSENDI